MTQKDSELHFDYVINKDPQSFLDPNVAATRLDPEKWKNAVTKMKKLCEESGVDVGNFAEWRVWTLHRTSMKRKPKQPDTGMNMIYGLNQQNKC